MRGLISEDAPVDHEARKRLNIYICAKINPIVEKLMEGLYIHQPADIGDFIRDYLDGKVSSSLSGRLAVHSDKRRRDVELLDGYIKTDITPFFQRLIESLYVHKPSNIEEFIRDFIDGKVAETKSMVEIDRLAEGKHSDD